MQDAIIKGIGNSRYLKTVGEALSLYPTYEDFLQAMIAGTFPVDFNGINKDGWTQQGTLLNKANLLSDTVISTLGLSTGANSTPNDAFNVLANIGNVHVWRKTVVTEEEIPAGYKLGATITKATIFRGATSSYYFAAKAHATISVLDDGTPVVSGSNSGGQMGTISSVIADDGEFIYLEEISSSNGGNNLLIKPWLVKSVGGRSSLQFDVNTGNIECTGSFAQVTTYPTTPPGTHVTYLTSTNRNAYQEGDDAKEAGYVLGESKEYVCAEEVQTTAFFRVLYAQSVDVSPDGKVSLHEYQTSASFSLANEEASAGFCNSNVRGKFCSFELTNDTGIAQSSIVYIPDSATFTVETEYSKRKLNVNKAQIVTGYPAIPAGTTIEYLGVLGDKVTIVEGSYTLSRGETKKINLGFRPQIVMLYRNDTNTETASDLVLTSSRYVAFDNYNQYSVDFTILSNGFSTQWEQSREGDPYTIDYKAISGGLIE